ncbi:MAG: hypothetical protein PVG07_04720 [Acidobacteriota bacterium]|jgi:hypothetical protein
MKPPPRREGRRGARSPDTPHPGPEELRSFALGRSLPEDTARVGLHLARCSGCRRRLAESGIGATGAGRPGPFDQAFRRASETARRAAIGLEESRRASDGSLAHLRNLTPEERSRAIRSTPRLRSFAFARHLLDTCRATWSDDPYAAEELAAMAVLVGDHLPHREYGRRPLGDLRAEAWALVANCRRIRSDLRSVPTAFERAEELLGRGTGDPREEAELRALQVSFLRDLGHPGRALETIDHTIDLSRRVGSEKDRLRYLVSKAIVLHDLGRTGDAVHLLLEHRGLAGRSHDPKLALLMQLNLALFFNELGDSGRAVRLLRRAGTPIGRHGAHTERTRLRWIMGLILRNLGRFSEAEAALQDARSAFHTARIPADTALVDLDLAHLHLETGDRREALRLAAAAFPVFAVRGMEPPTRTALELFRKAGGLG